MNKREMLLEVLGWCFVALCSGVIFIGMMLL